MSNLIENRQIRVFISSTFRDMQDERDYLMKRTFPKLRKLAAERDVTLTELDLRWGITEEESKSGKVVEICLREIENSIPFFIGIIGNRYGWVPEKKDLDDNVTKRFQAVNDYLERHLSVTEMEMQFGVLAREEDMHAYFYIKEQELENEQDNPEKLKKLKSAIKSSKYPHFTYSSSEDLANQVEMAFTSLLNQLFPRDNISDYEKECIAQRSYMNQLCQNYIKDEKNFEALDTWLADDGSRQFVVTGTSGLGKSALVANWLKEKLERKDTAFHIVYYFVGNGSSDSSSKENVEKALVANINHAYGWEIHQEESENNLKKTFEQVLVYGDKPLLVIVDAINQILDDDNAKLLNWFPSVNKKIKVVFTTLEDDTTMGVFQNRHYPIFTLTPLDIDRRRQLVKYYLLSFAKKLTAEQTCRIASDRQCENTMILRTLLDALVNFGIYEELDSRIDYYLSKKSISDFYQALLLSYENEYAGHGKDFIKHILSAISVSRNGLSEDEIIQITGIKPLYWSQFYCAFSSHLIVRNGLISFSHCHIRAAVVIRYINNNHAWASKCRNEIIELLKGNNSHRAWDELPYQYDKLDLDKSLFSILSKVEVFLYLRSKEEYDVSKYWHKLTEHGYDISIYKDVLKREEPPKKKYNEVISFIVQFFSLYELGIELCKDYECYLNSHESVQNEDDTIEKFFIWKGIIYRSLGQYSDALKAFNSALTESIKNHGERHEITSHTIMHVGTIYNKTRKYDIAYDNYTKALDIQQELGLEKESINTIHSIADNYLDWGKYNLAEKLLFEALDKAIALLGKENDTISSLYNSLGSLYDYQGKYDDSIKYLKMGIEMDKSIYGLFNINTAHAYHNIAGTYANMGKMQEAEDAYRKSIKIKTKLLGGDNYDTSISLAGLGNILLKTGRYQEALEYHLKYLDSYKKTVGADDSYLAVIYAGIGTDYAAMEDYEKALVYHRKALEHAKSIESVVSSTFYNQIGNDLYNLCIYDEAIMNHTENLRLAVQEKNPHNISIAHNCLGHSYACIGQYDDALNHFQSALHIRESILGELHPDTVASYTNVAYAYSNAGNYEEAVPYFEKAIRSNCLPTWSEADHYKSMGICYRELRDYEKAAECALKALELNRQEYGEQHAEVARCHNSIGLAYRLMKRFDEALDHFKVALDIRMALLPRNHDDIKKSESYIEETIRMKQEDSE